MPGSTEPILRHRCRSTCRFGHCQQNTTRYSAPNLTLLPTRHLFAKLVSASFTNPNPGNDKGLDPADNQLDPTIQQISVVVTRTCLSNVQNHQTEQGLSRNVGHGVSELTCSLGTFVASIKDHWEQIANWVNQQSHQQNSCCLLDR